jgi:pyridoxamine 5'-phosphate oxidase
MVAEEWASLPTLSPGRVPKVYHVSTSDDGAPYARAMTDKIDIAQLRKSYELAELDEEASANQPLQQFDKWLREAIDARLPEPNAMTLATVSAQGRPSTRVVLIKGYDARGVVFYTNYASRKGR